VGVGRGVNRGGGSSRIASWSQGVEQEQEVSRRTKNEARWLPDSPEAATMATALPMSGPCRISKLTLLRSLLLSSVVHLGIRKVGRGGWVR
jgi:hypothetical protein